VFASVQLHIAMLQVETIAFQISILFVKTFSQETISPFLKVCKNVSFLSDITKLHVLSSQVFITQVNIFCIY
jgi:hypothetical protein